MHLKLSVSLLALGVSFLPSALAVFEDEAYNIDYHHALLGLPQAHTTFFHRPRKDDKASLLYTLSDLGVLGAVNPGTGSIVWRQFLADKGNSGADVGAGFLRAGEDRQEVISALGGTVNSWDAFSGRERWSNTFEGLVKDLEVLETVGDETEKDVLVLFEEAGKTGGVLRRLDGGSGDVVWEFKTEGGDVPFQVSTDVKSIFVVSLHGAWGGYNLKITTVDPVTGARVEEHTLAAKADIHAAEDVLFVGANMAAPIIAWTDKTMKTLKVNILGTKQIHSLTLATGEDVTKVVVHAPHLIQSKPHFLVHTQSAASNWAEVYHIDLVAGTLTEAYHLPKLPGKGAFSTSSQEANVFFTRTSMDEVIVVSSASHAILGRYQLETGSEAAIHGVSEVVPKAGNTYAVRSAVVTTGENWVMVRNGQPAWTRVEGLSGGVAAAWAEIPESEELAKELDVEAHSNPVSAYIHRLERHISDLQYLPAYLQALPVRFLSSLFSTETVVSSDTLVRDNFGFRKLIIVATARGRVYALDSANQGKVLWSTKTFDLPVGDKWDVKGIYVDNVKGVATIRGSEGEYIIINTVDGKNIETMWRGSFPPVQSTALVDSHLGKWLLPIGADGNPGNLPTGWAPKDILVVRGSNGEVKGIKFDVAGESSSPSTVWTFTPTLGQRIYSVTARPAHDPVASIGLARSDRSVLYKYLNPNTILITAVNDAVSFATFYLVDSVSGEILYSAIHEKIDTTQPIATLLSENWFVYSVFSDINPSNATSSATKGYKLVVSEFFESPLTNDRGPLSSAANYSSLLPSSETFDDPTFPHVKSQSYLFPEPISHLAVTQTRQGITTRKILCTLPASNAIIGLPKALLDPRRPVGVKLTPGEMEEGLVQYAPLIGLDPNLVITHAREVMGLQNVITTPALLESTSLVFAYGVDVFGTRVTPSLAFDILGKGFNKIALVGTVTLLAAGVGFVAPMVRRKQINTRWKT